MTILNNISLKVLKFLVLLFPVSFLFGSPMINTCTILISLTGLFYYNKNIFSWLDKIPLYITTLFFLCIIFSSYYQFVSGEENKDTVIALNASGADVSFAEIKTEKGHDSFLVNEPEFLKTLKGFIDSMHIKFKNEKRI